MPRSSCSIVLVGWLLTGCGSASTTFVGWPFDQEARFVISLLREGGHIDLARSRVLPGGFEARTNLDITLEPEEELLWLAFDDETLVRGLRARANLDDLSRVQIRTGSGLDCGPAGQELSFDLSAGSMVRQAFSRFAPSMWKLGAGQREFTEDSLSREPDLSGFELELPADVEDCGLSAPTAGTPFTEGGVFRYPFDVGDATLTTADYWFGEILGIAAVDEGRYALQARRAVYVIERGTSFDPARDPHLRIDELPLPQLGELTWDIRSIATVPSADGRATRIFILAFSYTSATKDQRHAAIVQFDFDGRSFFGGTIRWFGNEVDFPEQLAADPLGGLVMLGRKGLVVFAPDTESPFVERTLGSGDLRAIASTKNPLYRHVIAERGGGIFLGDLGRDAPFQQRLARASLTATNLAMDTEPDARRLYSGWRDGGVYVSDLSFSEPFRDLEFELSRRSAECGAPTIGACGRTTVSVELSSLAILRASALGDELLVVTSGCSHGIVFNPSSGCTRVLGEGRPVSGSPALRVIGTTDGVIWLGGYDGQVYSVP